MSAVFALAALIANPGEVTLKVATSQGFIRTLRHETSFSIEKVKFVYRSVTKEEHLAGSEGKSFYKSSLTEGTLIVPGSRIPLTAPELTLAVSLRGEPLKSQSEDAAAFRLRRLTSVPLPVGPVKPGDSWQINYLPDGSGVPEVRFTCRFLAAEKILGVDAAKIAVTVREALPGEASAEYTAWVDLATGLPVRSRADLKKALIAGSVVDATWSMALNTDAKP